MLSDKQNAIQTVSQEQQHYDVLLVSVTRKQHFLCPYILCASDIKHCTHAIQ